MKALILVGGFGTRLRPLTWTRPKPLVPFANRPMVLQQIAALKKVGVTEVVLAVNYQSETFAAQLAEWEKEFNMKFTCSLEKEPMGTAGPLALAASILGGGADVPETTPFFVLNSDVVVAFEEHKIFDRMIAFHKNHGKEGTMLVTKVQDPTKYGVVVADKEGKISAFVEKPKDHSFGDCINAGIYLLNKSVLKRIPLKPTSIERETFPAMVKDAQLYSQTVTGFWMDIGQPKDYLVGMEMFLNDTADSKYAASKVDAKHFAADIKLAGNLIIDRSATFGSKCSVGPNVIIGRNVVIGNGVTLERCTLFDGARVEHGATVKSSILGFNSIIRAGATVTNSTLGDGVVIGASAVVDEAKLFHQFESSSTSLKFTFVDAKGDASGDAVRAKFTDVDVASEAAADSKAAGSPAEVVYRHSKGGVLQIGANLYRDDSTEAFIVTRVAAGESVAHTAKPVAASGEIVLAGAKHSVRLVRVTPHKL